MTTSQKPVIIEASNESVTLRLVNPFEVAEWWGRVKGMLEQVWARDGDYCTLSLDEYYTLLLSGSRQLWLLLTPDGEVIGAGITAVTDYPDLRQMSIIIAAGKTGEALPFYDQALSLFIQLAARWKCNRVLIEGRRGWKRLLSGEGFVEVATKFVKRI